MTKPDDAKGETANSFDWPAPEPRTCPVCQKEINGPYVFAYFPWGRDMIHKSCGPVKANP